MREKICENVCSSDETVRLLSVLFFDVENKSSASVPCCYLEDNCCTRAEIPLLTLCAPKIERTVEYAVFNMYEKLAHIKSICVLCFCMVLISTLRQQAKHSIQLWPAPTRRLRKHKNGFLIVLPSALLCARGQRPRIHHGRSEVVPLFNDCARE
jgi:hypothetical protein